MKVIPQSELPQGSDEWHQLRRSFGMASEAACVMGHAAWEPRTWLQLYELKRGERSIEDSPAMAFGRRAEPTARQAFVSEHRIDAEPCVVLNGELGASLDGIDLPDCPVEIKCPYSGTEGELWRAVENAPALVRKEHVPDALPLHYWWQLQHQMAVTGSAHALFYVWTPSASRTLTVERDEDAITALRAAWSEFLRHVREADPPTPSEADVVKRDDDEAFVAAVEEYRAARDVLKAAEKCERAARQQLIDLTGDQSSEARGLRVTRFWRKGNVRYRDIPELEAVDVEQYRSEGKIQYTVKEVAG